MTAAVSGGGAGPGRPRRPPPPRPRRGPTSEGGASRRTRGRYGGVPAARRGVVDLLRAAADHRPAGVRGLGRRLRPGSASSLEVLARRGGPARTAAPRPRSHREARRCPRRGPGRPPSSAGRPRGSPSPWRSVHADPRIDGGFTGRAGRRLPGMTGSRLGLGAAADPAVGSGSVSARLPGFSAEPPPPKRSSSRAAPRTPGRPEVGEAAVAALCR